jgi:hypothetical protein
LRHERRYSDLSLLQHEEAGEGMDNAATALVRRTGGVAANSTIDDSIPSRENFAGLLRETSPERP